jgi:hypothetical protein
MLAWHGNVNGTTQTLFFFFLLLFCFVLLRWHQFMSGTLAENGHRLGSPSMNLARVDEQCDLIVLGAGINLTSDPTGGGGYSIEVKVQRCKQEEKRAGEGGGGVCKMHVCVFLIDLSQPLCRAILGVILL